MGSGSEFSVQSKGDSLESLYSWASSVLSFSTTGRVWQSFHQSPEIEKTKKVFKRKKQDTYKGLETKLREMVSSVDLTNPVNVEKIKKIYEAVRFLFIQCSRSTKPFEILQAADLLEAYNTIFTLHEDRQKTLGISRIKASDMVPDPTGAKRVSTAVATPLQSITAVSQTTILLADYQKLQKVTERIKELQSEGALTRDQVQTLVQEQQFDIEPVPMGKMIDLLYRHSFTGRIAIGRVVTQIAAWRFGSKALVEKVLKTVKFYRKMHIDLWMDIGGEIYSFKELFGYDLREPKSLHESFTRSITKKALELLLKTAGYTDLQAEVRSEMKDGTAQVIAANAFSRNSVFTVEAGTIQRPHQIREKRLDPDRVEQVEETYAQKTEFSLFSAFGSFAVESTPVTGDACQNQAALLASLGAFVDGHRCLCNVSRLAPADVHHYVSPVEAEIMSRKEVCEFLQAELAKQQTPSADQACQLQSLLKYFKNHPDGEASTLNIAGSTLESVSTKAVTKQSGILSTNDRKVMVLRHKDGSVSIHILVGASAVNSIGSTQKTGAVRVGESLGWMSFGSKGVNPTTAMDDWVCEKTGKRFTRPILIRLLAYMVSSVAKVCRWCTSDHTKIKKKEEQKVSTATFEPGGSTVVSLYLSRDYLPVPQVEQFNAVGVREAAGTPETIEVRCRIGDPLATPTVYQTLLFLKKFGIDKGTPKEKLEQLKKKIDELDKDSEDAKSGIGKLWKNIFDTIDVQNPFWIGLAKGDDAYVIQKTVQALVSQPS